MNAKLQELIALLRDKEGEVKEIEVLSNEEYFIKVSQGNYKKINRNRDTIG